MRRREFPPKDGRPAQVLLTVEDGERFGAFVPKDDELAKVQEGQFVELHGPLQVRRSNGFVNLNITDVEGWQAFELKPVGAAKAG